MQDEKIEIPEILSHQSPLETIFENTRLSSFDFIFSKIINFFNFHLRETFKSTKNVRDILASWMETETNAMTFPTLKNFMILPLYLNVVTILKISIWVSNIFSKLPSKSVLSRPSILSFFNGENPFLVYGFHTKNGIPEKEQCWNQMLGQFKLQVEILDYNTSLTCVFVYFCRICNCYNLCTKRLKEKRLRDKELWDPGYTAKKFKSYRSKKRNSRGTFCNYNRETCK